MAVDETPARLHFRRNESGQIAGFDLSIPLAENIEFAKLNERPFARSGEEIRTEEGLCSRDSGV